MIRVDSTRSFRVLDETIGAWLSVESPEWVLITVERGTIPDGMLTKEPFTDDVTITLGFWVEPTERLPGGTYTKKGYPLGTSRRTLHGSRYPLYFSVGLFSGSCHRRHPMTAHPIMSSTLP